MPHVTARRPRPALRYHGGKHLLAPWILSFFPPHRTYVEPYGGAASVLLRKRPTYAEVYNDLDDEVVTVFRVLRDPALAEQLRRLLTLTPFARAEFMAAHERVTDPVESARRTIIRSFMGFGGASIHSANPRGLRTRASQWTRGRSTGFRANCNRSGSTPAQDWSRYPEQIPYFVERLRSVVIEQRDAIDVIRQHDGPETLIYCDPPYPMSTRDDHRADYAHEMTDADHRILAVCLHAAQGMVVLSGYACDLYDRELYPGWERHQREHRADGARKRTEVVWLNPACSAALHSTGLWQILKAIPALADWADSRVGGEEEVNG